jgi:hypothetical protein
LGPALRLQSGISRPVGNAMIKCNTGGTEAHSNHYDRLSILQLPTIDFVLHHTKPPPHKRKSEPNKKKPTSK